jgi:hypothetical protein
VVASLTVAERQRALVILALLGVIGLFMAGAGANRPDHLSGGRRRETIQSHHGQL